MKRDPTPSASEGSRRDAGIKLILTKLATGGDRRSTSRTLESNSLKGYGARDAIQYLNVLLSSHDEAGAFLGSISISIRISRSGNVFLPLTLLFTGSHTRSTNVSFSMFINTPSPC